jgi:hypothetical protein
LRSWVELPDGRVSDVRRIEVVGRSAAAPSRCRGPRRFTEGGFARFNASAPKAASTAEGPGEPVRHRYNPGVNRRVNAILHRMAVTQLRCEPRAQKIYAQARANGPHTKKEARRILKRHLSDVVYRRMIRDLTAHPAQPLLVAEPRAAAAPSRVARQGRAKRAA